MNPTQTSLRIFGIYMILIPGIGLILFPDFILTLFGLRHGEELWLARMIGLLALIIGVFDYFLGTYKIEKLYMHTVVLRYFAAAFMIVLWLMNEVEIMILLFAAIDALAATWTLLTLKRSRG